MKQIPLIVAALVLLVGLGAPARADVPSNAAEQPFGEVDPEMERLLALEASLVFVTGEVSLRDGLATIDLGDRLRYLGPDDTNRVVQAWGNPPMPDNLGMLVPTELSVFDAESWAVLITYLEDGHVEDDDADELDYDDLLTQMKEEIEAENAQRRDLGLRQLTLVGWAETPHYDAAHHHLYWARELRSSDGVSTLNYDIRLLGRKGVLSLNALTSMHRLGAVRDDMQEVLTAVRFAPGNRYADFDPEMDEVAAYGLGALIMGKVASKVGIFAALGALLLKAKKLLFFAVIAAVALAKRLLGTKNAEKNDPAEA